MERSASTAGCTRCWGSSTVSAATVARGPGSRTERSASRGSWTGRTARTRTRSRAADRPGAWGRRSGSAWNAASEQVPSGGGARDGVTDRDPGALTQTGRADVREDAVAVPQLDGEPAQAATV